MVGLLHHRPEDPLDFLDVCLERAREIGWKNIRWNTFVEEKEGINIISLQLCHTVIVSVGLSHNLLPVKIYYVFRSINILFASSFNCLLAFYF